MSLINRVLQDLEARRAPPETDASVTEHVRAVPTPKPQNHRRLAGILAASLVVVTAIAFALTGNPLLISKLNPSRHDAPPVLPASTVAQTPAEKTVAPGSVEAQVEAALMMPVFQLSEELSIVPEARLARAAAKMASVASSANVTAQSAGGANNRVATPGPQAGQAGSASPARHESGKQGDTQAGMADAAKPTRQTIKVSKTSVAPEAVTFDRSTDEELQEVVIPADVAMAPIEKQSRQLTSFERAENSFRLGVASLRRGRMADAEAQFRAAISEDRSHDAAQQALVGVLIDAGRLGDAEAVLNESLSANPRQPKQAMLLARLQVERGDTDTAIRTLEATRIYAGTDAVYLSFLAAVLQRKGRHEEAVTQYRSALAFMPRNAIWLMGLGISLRALGSNSDALRVFDEAATTGTLDPGLQAFVDQQRAQLSKAVN